MTSHAPIGLRALLAAALLTLAAIPARADDSAADDSVGVVVTGEATMQPQLVAQLETWLRSHGHNLVSAPLPPDAINALIDCFVIEDQACARRIIDMRAKSDAVVFAQVTVAAGATAIDRTVTLTAYWLNKGTRAIQERRTCERCTDATMRSTADELMEALSAAGSNRSRIKLTSTPSGARVTVGGKEIGQTPLDYTLPAGEHRLVFELEGRATETRRVTIERGEPLTIDVELGLPPPSRAPAFAVLGGGAALAIAGGIMIGIDEDVPADPTVREYLDTGPAGVALVAAGAVAIGVGVYLLVRSPGKRSAPAVSLVPGGGGVIGWTGRF